MVVCCYGHPCAQVQSWTRLTSEAAFWSPCQMCWEPPGGVWVSHSTLWCQLPAGCNSWNAWRLKSSSKGFKFQSKVLKGSEKWEDTTNHTFQLTGWRWKTTATYAEKQGRESWRILACQRFGTWTFMGCYVLNINVKQCQQQSTICFKQVRELCRYSEDVYSESSCFQQGLQWMATIRLCQSSSLRSW